ncbi:MAG TPA: hypothetical protein VG425_16250 [Casimicrobiaceae bacterium]|jgi:hypothetical protein|nr:hypothetical protein [Casimicrobiaceae bacterium]
MRRTISILLLCLPALACAAAKAPEGRWEGPLHIPGRELRLVVDLAQDGAGAWTGSIIIPSLGIKGAPLANLVVTETNLSFDIGDLLRSPTYGPAAFKAHLSAGDGMAGEMSQGGNVAPFLLQRIASPQVELPPRSTAVRREIEDRWTGEYELGGYARHVTITLENHADAGATARFVIVGKRTYDLPVNLVLEEDNFLRIESRANQVAFEGRIVKDRGEITGVIEVGSSERPLVLRRDSARAP